MLKSFNEQSMIVLIKKIGFSPIKALVAPQFGALMGKLSQKWTWMPLQVHYCCRRSHPNELLYIIVNRLFFITNSSQINMVSISDGRAASVV
ncbi:hypothetical protein V6Z12_D11G086800 [Gossypium hirsutum]